MAHRDDLVVPDNITPVFLPPYSPEFESDRAALLYLKDSRLTHRVFSGTEIVEACCDAWNALLAETGRIPSLLPLSLARKGQPPGHVGMIRRQATPLGAGRLDKLAHLGIFMRLKIVHDNDIAELECRH
ncbi:MAG TPA: hypothetical protein VG651_23480 [Stellaceae bacterium]|nr:hypothetical protein [Stellaceae bacterium]